MTNYNIFVWIFMVIMLTPQKNVVFLENVFSRNTNFTHAIWKISEDIFNTKLFYNNLFL